MSLIVSLIIGGLVGWLASIVMKTNAQMGMIANVLVGLVGSSLGFWLAGLLGIAPAGGILRFGIAIAGAVLLIFILGKVGFFRKK
ncbi:GlsB/YeaQ/YmgE family stress response membrane protein [Trichloromonas sp.]|uniref:GlsB/YeaQ/YmgE family stress response membrane protein n=1 Tax=Trichloromonas sp. TaxID=3069249 RepID=UPI002A45C6A4|nr:GlsB/YeaQ/YmgE family stress response membrane protein [Trichloromonas sp.]